MTNNTEHNTTITEQESEALGSEATINSNHTMEGEESIQLDEKQNSQDAQDTNKPDAPPSSTAPNEQQASLISKLQLEINDLSNQQKELQNELLRAQAEVQNTRRRLEKDVASAHKYALEKFIDGLIPVIDSLERGLESIPEEDETQRVAREGMSLTCKLFLETLRKFHVEQLFPLSESFNPDFHQAISTQACSKEKPNTVLSVLQKGYTLNNRLIRPALVTVSKAMDTKKDDEKV